MKILIYGSGKTGTTALTYAIKNSFQTEDYNIVFEPSSLADIDYSEANIIVKSLRVQQWKQDIKYLDFFDKKIIIVRHPFDALISHLLYSPFNGLGFSSDRNSSQYVNLLKRKVAQPDSILLQEIINSYQDITKNNILDFLKNDCQNILEIVRQNIFDIHKLKYEDFVDGNLNRLSDYLDSKVKNEVKVDEKFKRVARSKKHSDWKNWFTQNDIKELSNLFADFITFLSYEAALDHQKKNIFPETSYLYVIKVINEYRKNYGIPEFQDGIINIGEEGNYIDNAIRCLQSDNLVNFRNNIVKASKLNPELQKTYSCLEHLYKTKKEFLKKQKDSSSLDGVTQINVVKLIPENSDFILGFFLDSPVNNQKNLNQDYILIRGWIVGKQVPAKTLELISNNKLIGVTPINITRSGVFKLFPEVFWAENSGFELQLPIESKKTNIEILLRVVFENEFFIDLAIIEVVL
jgi:hypothetical protein